MKDNPWLVLSLATINLYDSYQAMRSALASIGFVMAATLMASCSDSGNDLARVREELRVVVADSAALKNEIAIQAKALSENQNELQMLKTDLVSLKAQLGAQASVLIEKDKHLQALTGEVVAIKAQAVKAAIEFDGRSEALKTELAEVKASLGGKVKVGGLPQDEQSAARSLVGRWVCHVPPDTGKGQLGLHPDGSSDCFEFGENGSIRSWIIDKTSGRVTSIGDDTGGSFALDKQKFSDSGEYYWRVNVVFPKSNLRQQYALRGDGALQYYRGEWRLARKVGN